jgi:hypothetical protein
MKKTLLLLMSVLLIGQSVGQVGMTLIPPVGGLVNKAQLWQIILVNPGEAKEGLIAQISLVDVVSGTELLSGRSSRITVPKGSRLFQSRDFEPIEYDHQAASILNSAGGFIPVGMYRVCFSLVEAGTHAVTPSSEQCVSFEVQSLSPPQLIFPLDSAEVAEKYPQFSWLPPAPAQLFSDLSFDFVLTEQRLNQSAYEAIQENIAVYHKSGLRVPYHAYPSTFPELDSNKVYVWRVIAKNGEVFAGQSEVWTFVLKKHRPPTDSIEYTPFHVISSLTRSGGMVSLQKRVLHLKFYSYLPNYQALVNILDEQGRVVDQFSRTVGYGDNYWNISLNRKLTAGKRYQLLFFDAEQQSMGIQFLIQE